MRKSYPLEVYEKADKILTYVILALFFLCLILIAFMP